MQNKKEESKKEEKKEGSMMDDLTKKQVFKKFSYRGNDISKLLSLKMDELSKLLRARQRRRLRRKLKKNYGKFMKKLVEAKKNCPAGEKPKAIKTHLRDCIVLPNMVQSVVSIYNGRVFNNVEIRPEMIGYYLGEFSVTYKKVKHGKAGIGATHSSKFVPIK